MTKKFSAYAKTTCWWNSSRLSCYPRRLPIDTYLVSKKFYKSPLTNYDFGVAMGGLLLKLQNFKKVKLIFGHPVHGSNQINFLLTTHNWQKWKRVFLTCPYHEIYRVEAIGLKNFNYTWKIMIFANMWNLGQFREKSIFCQ